MSKRHPRPADKSGPQKLYRLRDRRGRLLYVGVTRDAEQRFADHRVNSWEWWPAVHSVAVEEYPDRKSAEDAEKAAIADERPAMNVFHMADRATWRSHGWYSPPIGIERRLFAQGRRVAQARGESLNDVIVEAIRAYVGRNAEILDD